MTSVANDSTQTEFSGPKRGWLVILCVSRMLQMSVATSWAGVLPQVLDDWDLTASRAGVVQSSWHVGYLISLFATGFVADRIGPRRVFWVCSVLTASSALAYSVGISGPNSAALLFGLTGFFAAGCYGPGLQLLAANSPPRQRGSAMGMYLGASSLGFALSLALIALLSSIASWRTSLMVISACVVGGAVLTFFALDRMKPDFVVKSSAQRMGLRHALKETVNDRAAMAGNWAYAAHCWELMALWAWLPTYLAAVATDQGFSLKAGIALAAAAHLFSVFGSLFGGSASDRFGSVRVMMCATCISIFFSLTFGWMWGLPLALVAGIGALYNMSAIADSAVYSSALADVVPTARLGAAYSVRSVMGFGAGAISPWVFGMALDWGQMHLDSMLHSWSLAWTTAAVGALAGPFMIMRFRRLSQQN